MTVPFKRGFNYIYLDQDGVLANFDKYVREVLGFHLGNQSEERDDEMWELIATIPNFYELLDPMPRYLELITVALEIDPDRTEILTALPRKKTMPESKGQKKNWVTDNIEVFDIWLPFNIGPYSRDKWKHCMPGDILVDDRPANIEEWNRAGGNGILYLTPDQAINDLRKFLM